MTPAYTSSKLKQMTPSIIESIQDYTKRLQKYIQEKDRKLENYILRE